MCIIRHLLILQNVPQKEYPNVHYELWLMKMSLWVVPCCTTGTKHSDEFPVCESGHEGNDYIETMLCAQFAECETTP